MTGWMDGHGSESEEQNGNRVVVGEKASNLLTAVAVWKPNSVSIFNRRIVKI